MVTIAYRNIYYYKKYIIKCANVWEERVRKNERGIKRERMRDEWMKEWEEKKKNSMREAECSRGPSDFSKGYF